MQSTEQWLPVPSEFGPYEVSSRGGIRSVRNGVVRVMKPYKHPDGHLQVALWRDGQKRHMWVHRLMLMVFDRMPEHGEVARHLNDVPDDNRLDNLAWGSHRDNRLDAVRNGIESGGARGNKQVARKACARGHELSGNNLAYRKDRAVRICLTCSRMRARRGGYSESEAEVLYSQIMSGEYEAMKNNCKRGHLLFGANLSPSGLEENKRRCLACQRARSRADSAGIPLTQELADAYYEEIVKGESSAVPDRTRARSADGRYASAGRRIYPAQDGDNDD